MLNSRYPWWFLALCVVAPLVFFAAMHFVEGRQTVDERWQNLASNFRTQVILDDALLPPSLDADWRPLAASTTQLGKVNDRTSVWLRIELPAPDGSAVDDPAIDRSADNRSRQERPELSHRWTLFHPAPNGTNLSLWLHGIRYDGVGSHQAPPLTMPNNPIKLTFDALALPEHKPELYLHLTRDLGGISLSRLSLGPEQALAGHVQQLVFAKETLPRILLIMMAMMTIVTFFIHLLRRKTTNLYGWWTFAIFVSFLYSAHGQHESAAFGSLWFWWRTTYITLAAYVVASAIFVNRLIGKPQPLVERAMLIVLAAGSSFILLNPVDVPTFTLLYKTLWIPAIIGAGVYMLWRLWLGTREPDNSDALVLLAITFCGVCVGVRDYLFNDLQLISGSMLYMRHCAGLMVIIYSFVLVRRFSRSVPTLTGAAETGEALEAASERHRSLLEQEHRALEAQLQSAAARIAPSDEASQLNTNLHAARNDLQLIRDSITSEGAGQDRVIENMQERLSRSAEQQQVQLRWLSAASDPRWPTKNHLQLALARFLQTAIAEALAFEGAEQVEVSLADDEGSLARPLHQRATIRVQAKTEMKFERLTQYEAASRDLAGTFTITYQGAADEQGYAAELVLRWPTQS